MFLSHLLVKVPDVQVEVFWLSVKRRIENWRKREDSALRAGIFKA